MCSGLRVSARSMDFSASSIRPTCQSTTPIRMCASSRLGRPARAADSSRIAPAWSNPPGGLQMSRART